MPTDSDDSNEDPREPRDVEDSGDQRFTAPPPLSKTPLFQAIHAARYQRQALLREIQRET